MKKEPYHFGCPCWQGQNNTRCDVCAQYKESQPPALPDAPARGGEVADAVKEAQWFLECDQATGDWNISDGKKRHAIETLIQSAQREVPDLQALMDAAIEDIDCPSGKENEYGGIIRRVLNKLLSRGYLSVKQREVTGGDNKGLSHGIEPPKMHPSPCTRKHLDEATSEELMRRYQERDGC